MKKIKELLNKPIWTVIILLGSLIPVIFVAIYNRGCADDFNYTILTHQAVENHTSVIKAALQTVNYYMNNWNGLYFSSFLQSLSFTVFSQKLAIMNTVLIVSGIYISICFLAYVIIKRIAECKDVNWFIIGLFIATYFVQTIPSPVQGLYWYNGAVSYVFAYALCIFSMALTLMYMFDTKIIHKKVMFVIGLCFTIMVAGTHQMVEGLLLGFLLLTTIYTIFTRRNREISVYLVAAVIGAIINLICPGARARFGTTLESGHNLIKIFVKGFIYLIQYQIQWFTVSTILLVIALVVLSRTFIKKYSYMITGKRLIGIVGICQTFVFGEIFIPMFTMEELGTLRAVNVIYFTYVLTMCIIAIACVMYIHQKLNKIVDITFNAENCKWIFHVTCMVCATYIGIIGIGTCIRVPYGSTAVNAIKDIISGEAARYASELDEREEIYHSGKNEAVTVKPLTVEPYTLYFGDLKEKDYWRNQSVAEYYGLESVEVSFTKEEVEK